MADLYPVALSEWTATHTTTSSTNAEATHAAESARSHYVCGFMASVDDQAYAPETGTVTLLNGTTVVFTMVIQSNSVKSYQAGNGSALVVNFTAPVKMTEGAAVTLKVDPSGSTAASINANVWGFTR